jgi:hypothetical protein
MRCKLFFIFFITGTCSLNTVTVLAQGPPIYTDTPVLLGLEGSGIRTFGKFVKKQQANIFIQPLVFPYNLTPKILVGAILPLVNKNPDNLAARAGIGDVALFVKKTIFQQDGKAKTFRIVGKIKQVFPTGNTTETPALGAASYQTLFGVVTGYITTKIGLYSDIGYNVTSNGLSDNFVYNFAVGYPLLPQQYPAKQVNIYLELNGNYQFESAANSLFLSPGLQWITGRRLLIESGVQLPVVEQVDDSQKTIFVATLGIRVLLF